MRKILFAAAFLAVVGLVVSPALAQSTTGQITGLAVDEEGNSVAGATVTATSPALQGERVVTTDSQGKFNLAVLPTGVYKLKFNKAGHQGFILGDVLVLLGQISPVQVTLKKGEITETVTVTSTFPLIETKTADTSLNLSSKTLDTIPTAARSFRDLTKMVPSITSVELNTTGAGRVGYPSIRGEGQYGDNYLIDGLTVRDPAVKTTATPMPFDAIEEIQIITDGFSPEYGQALGGSVNVITKSGSNQFGGEVAYIYRSDAMAAEFQPTFLATPNEWEQIEPYVNVGGPIMKDKLWFFASYNRVDDEDIYAATEITDYGLLPAGVQDTLQNTYFGKLTYAVNSRHNVSLNYTDRDVEISGLGADDSTPEARAGQEIADWRLRFNYQAVFTANSVLEVKYGQMERDLLLTPDSGSRDNAQYRLTSVGVNINNAWRNSIDGRERKDYAAIYTHFWNPGGRLGSHEFKVGYEVHEPEQMSEDAWTGVGEDVFAIGVVPGAADEGIADTFDTGAMFQFRTEGDALVPEGLNEYRSGGAMGNRSEEQGVFLQDRWELGNWNFMAGFRMDKQTGYNDADAVFFSYEFGKSFSPRLSATWDFTGDGKNVLKAGWGRLYDVATTRFGEFANERESFAFRTYEWSGGDNWAGVDFETEKDTGSAYDIHDPDNWAWVHEQSSQSNPLDYSPVEKPAHSDRTLVEYNRQIANDYALKFRFVNAKSRGLIEDIAYSLVDWRVVNTDLKRRDYDSFELEFNGRPSPNITFNASYVHSSSKGTNPGQFEASGFLGTSGSGNNIGVFLDTIPSDPDVWFDIYGPTGTPFAPDDYTRDYNNDDVIDNYDTDVYWGTRFAGLGGLDGDEDWYGLLPYSIDDQLKLYGRFNIPKWGDTYVSAFAAWSSGYRTQRRGYQHLYHDYLTFSENEYFDGTEGYCSTFANCTNLYGQIDIPDRDFEEEDGLKRGTVENDLFWTLDLTVGKVFNLGGRIGLEVRGEFFNVFNNQVPLAIQDRATGTFGDTLTRQFPRSARASLRISF